MHVNSKQNKKQVPVSTVNIGELATENKTKTVACEHISNDAKLKRK